LHFSCLFVGERLNASYRYKTEVIAASQAERRFYYLSSASFGVPYISLFLVVIFAFGYGSKLVREGTIDPADGDIFLVLLCTVYVAESIGSVC
jgi:hypothetical protein